MGLLDSILSNTVGVAYRATTGNVDPWTVDQQKQDVAAAVAQASGPNADPAQVAIAQAQAQAEIDAELMSAHAHPDQSGLRIGGVIGTLLGGGKDGIVIGGPDDNTTSLLAALQKYVYGAIAVGAIVGGFWLYRSYGGIVKGAFRKR